MNTSQSARVANIGAAEQRKRRVFGLIALSAGVVIAAILIVIRAPLLWRLPLFLVFFAAGLGVFQARDKT